MTRVKLIFNDLKLTYDADNYSQILLKQIEVIKAYDKKQKANGNSTNTRENQIFFLMQFARTVKKSFDDVTDDDITNFLAQDIKQSTRNWYISILKIFFRWYKREELIEDLKQKPCDTSIESKDLWTEKEIKMLIKVAHNSRDKCAIAMLYDLSIERKCIQQMNIEDIECNGSGVYITVHGKRRGNRGKRRLQCISSAPYVIDWLNTHPMKNNKEAPFFISFAYKTFGNRVSNNFIYELLQLLAKRAEIDKPIRPHLIRHSKLTDLYRKGFTGIALQKYAGWTSPLMEQRYVNLSNDEMDAKRLAVEKGIEWKPEQIEPSELISIACPRCKKMNTSTSQYCSSCFMPLDQKVISKEQMILEFIRSELYQNDKEVVKEYNLEFLAENYNQLIQEQNVKGRKQVKVHK